MFFVVSVLFFFLAFTLMDHSGIYVDLLLPYGLLTEMPLGFCFDFVSFFFFSVVSMISSVVFLYSSYYMDSPVTDLNKDNKRFFYLLFLFVGSMFFLVFSSTWVGVMLGWDGLGLISFLLVIYYNDSSSLDSGLITVFTNRLGDCLFILSFVFMFYGGWMSFDFLSLSDCLFFSVVLSLGCVTKSAQLPFSSWLPAAMAAPTPVSSLVHSSTLVTAGVYLLVRFNFLLQPFYPFLSFLSLCTIFLAGACALYETDFKKVVAMSTLSQLGFMVFSISSGMWLLGFLHMMFHAFFKSSLFLATGNLMHFFGGDQDSRYFGSLGVSYFSKIFFSMSCLSLMGFPFSLGFYSKDSILGGLLGECHSVSSLVFIVSCGFTVAYSLRLIYMGFLNFPSFSGSLSFKEDFLFFLPVSALFFCCLFVGNFFFFSFTVPVVLGFLDFFVGLLVMSLGGFIFFVAPSFYFIVSSLMSIFFLSILSSSVISGFMLPKITYKTEYTWGEILGGKGVYHMLSSFYSMVSSLYGLYFLSFPVFCVFLLFLWE